MSHRWTIPDAMTPARSTGAEVSHESLCVLNAGGVDAELVLEAYFEDREPVSSGAITIPARRSLHLRLDQPPRVGGLVIPTGVPYGLVATSDVVLSVQYSRLDTTQEAYTLMSIVPASG